MGFVVIGLQCLLQPYPTVADAGLYLSMIPLFPELTKSIPFDIDVNGKILGLRMLYPGLLTLLFTMVLAPVNWYYWVHHGSGNANFYYATTLVYNVTHVVIIVEVIRTHILKDVLSKNPTLKATDIYQK
jgi:phosphatidylinositol glycan class U